MTAPNYGDHHDYADGEDDEHDARELAADTAVPNWASSDDEDLSDTFGDGPDSGWWDAGASVEELLGPPDDELGPQRPARPPRQAEPPLTTREDVAQLLSRPNVSWSDCRRAAQAARAFEEWDLLEAAAVRALRIAHRGDYQFATTLGLAARQVLVAKCATATADGLADALRDGKAQLYAVADDARRAGRSTLANAVDGEAHAASQMLLLLTGADRSGALAQLAGQLRDYLGRADLAEQTASRGIQIDPDNPAPWVARAAARADQRDHAGALADLDRDLLKDNDHASPVRIRVLRALGRREEALALALEAAERKPSKPALTMLRLLADDLDDDSARAAAERLYKQAHGDTQARPASRLLGLLAARKLEAEGDYDKALLLSEIVANEGPPWKDVDELVVRLRRSRPQ